MANDLSCLAGAVYQIYCGSWCADQDRNRITQRAAEEESRNDR